MFHSNHLSGDSQEIADIQKQEKIVELRSATGPLSGRVKMFCTDACLRRYLVAQNWDLEKAKKMLEETLKWRSTYRPEEIQWNEVSIESETGKMYIANFQDRQGRTVVAITPAKQNTSSRDNQIKLLVYTLENAVLNLPKDQEQMVWLIDFTGWSLRNSTPLRTAKETVDILQNHYPDRLATGFLYNAPRIFEMFWEVIKRFLDPIMFQKVKFVYPNDERSSELLEKYFDLDKLPEEFGGRNKVTYDHEEYSKTMLKDDENSARFWDSEEKLGQASHVNNENAISDITTPSHIAA